MRYPGAGVSPPSRSGRHDLRRRSPDKTELVPPWRARLRAGRWPGDPGFFL